MKHPLMVDFFEKAELAIFHEFSACESKESLELILFKKRGLEEFQKFMHKILVDGDMALREVKENET